MRGKAIIFFAVSMLLRITPAYAGKSFRLLVQGAVRRDHPRVCGEKNVEMLKSLWKMGSPPRMRGKD